MTLASVGLVFLGIFFLSACQPQTVVEQKRDEQILSAKSGADVVPQPAPLPMPPVVNKEPEKTPYQKYPVAYTIVPTLLPPPDAPLYFGLTPGSPKPSQMVFVYLVAAIPNFQAGEELPEFRSQDEFDQFMDSWATEFAKDAANLKKLDELAKNYRWTTDPAFLEDQEVIVSPKLLESEPNYIKLTQRTLARRFIFKASGTTAIKGKNGAEDVEIPLVISEYTEAQRALGAARYSSGQNDCVSCHNKMGPFGETPFLKHSPEYLSFYTDAELLNIIKNSSYPSGDLLLNGNHKFVFASQDEEQGIVAHLRNTPPFFDLIVELVGGLNLRAAFRGFW